MQTKSANKPTVSFVIPCYNLAHYLCECVGSILSQSYPDFEVLIMDDCSSDNTAEIAQSFDDPRVKHIRNNVNLGPLPNYNKGIRMSAGRYIWLISADDYLRGPSILRRYVDVMDRNPSVGFTFCPGVSVLDGRETGIISHSAYGDRDQIIRSHTFLKAIGQGCFVLAAAGMVRRECYDKVGLFPLNVVFEGTPIDFIWGGDWYLWAMFALFFDVAYFAEPMVCYRQHEQSSTVSVTREKIRNCLLADIAIPWMLKQKGEEAGLIGTYTTCLSAIASEYAKQLSGKLYRSGRWSITVDQFEQSLRHNTQSPAERAWIRARAYASAADAFYHRGDVASAKQFYWTCLRNDPWIPSVYVKLILLSFGGVGDNLRLRLKKMVAS